MILYPEGEIFTIDKICGITYFLCATCLIQASELLIWENQVQLMGYALQGRQILGFILWKTETIILLQKLVKDKHRQGRLEGKNGLGKS